MATVSSGYEILNCDISMYDGTGMSMVGSGGAGISTGGSGIGSYKQSTWKASSYDVISTSGGASGNSRGKRSQYVYLDDVDNFISTGVNSYNYESPTFNIDLKDLNLDFEKWLLRGYGKPKNEYEVELI